MDAPKRLLLAVAALLAIAGAVLVVSIARGREPASPGTGVRGADADAPPAPGRPALAAREPAAGEEGGEPASEVAEPATATVAVTVLGDDERPLPGASVSVRGHKTKLEIGPVATGTDGEARVEGVPVGSVWITATLESHETASAPARTRAGEVASVRIVLHAFVPVTGRVRLRTGEGVAAEVRVTRGGTVAGKTETCSGAWCDIARTTSAADGTFRVDVPPDKILTVTASAEGYAPSGVAIRRKREGEEIVLTLEPGGTLQGVVRDPDGTPCAGAKVFVVPADEPRFLENPRYVIGADGSMSWSSSDEGDMMGASSGSSTFTGTTRTAIRLQTDPDGAYLVSGLRIPAAYRVLAEGCGGRGASEEVALSPETRVATAGVALAPRAVLVVRLQAPDGSPATEDLGLSIVGAREHFTDPRGGRVHRVGFDEDGTGRIEWLVAGTYDLLVHMRDSVPQRKRVEVPARGTTDVIVRGALGRSLRGVVVDGAGQPVGKARVNLYVSEATGIEEQTAEGTTGEDGRFLLTGLQDAPGTLSVEAPAFVRASLEGVRPGGELLRVVLLGGAVLRGRLAIRNGASLPGDVWIVESDGEHARGMRNAKIAADGSFAHPCPRVGETTTYVLLPRVGAPVVLGRFALKAEEVRDLGTIDVDDGRVVRGRVVDRAGAGLPGVVVTANPRDAPGMGDGMMVKAQDDTTDAEGRFTIRGVTKAPIVVTTMHASLAPARVVDPGPGDLTIALHPGAFLSGRLLDATGAARGRRAHLRIDVTGPSGVSSFDVLTDEDGSFESGPLETGPFTAYVLGGGTTAPDEIARGTLSDGERKTVEWRSR